MKSLGQEKGGMGRMFQPLAEKGSFGQVWYTVWCTRLCMASRPVMSWSQVWEVQVVTGSTLTAIGSCHHGSGKRLRQCRCFCAPHRRWTRGQVKRLHLAPLSHLSGVMVTMMCNGAVMHRQVLRQTAGACTACQPTAIWQNPLSRLAGRLWAGASPPFSPAPARTQRLKAATALTLLHMLSWRLQRVLHFPCQHRTLQVPCPRRDLAVMDLRHAILLQASGLL